MTYTAATAPNSGMIGQNVYTNITDLKAYNYVTLTTKVQFNKILGISNPLYGSFFFTDNRVSGTSISNLFDQQVYDITGRVQVIRNVNLLVDYGVETWKSNYTYPYIDYRTDSYGVGLAYDIPWGGAKLNIRYKHLIFKDKFVAGNDYEGDQIFSFFKLLM